MVTEKDFQLQQHVSRRSFLVKTTQIVLGLGIASVPDFSWAKVSEKRVKHPETQEKKFPEPRGKIAEKRSLSFFHTQIQRPLDVTYALGTKYDSSALVEINKFLRDHQTGQVHQIDPKLLDILWAIQREMGSKGVYDVISAYRSPKTNRGLRRFHCGVASHSLHMKGQAIDIRFSGTNIDQIHQCALAMQSGGVGYYPKSGFVHLDSGQFRTW
jgi:uncharacterized protein YcbK (DUF882 family)